MHKLKVMLSKTQVLQSMEELPEEFSANDLIDRIILLQKIGQAQQEFGKEKVSLLLK